MSARRWTVTKSAEGEWMSFDLYAASARLAQLTYHRTQPEALAATCQKAKRAAERAGQ
ncbi:hypothetical protein [Nocardia sp. NPDC049149]|uniref:hypothetical protein n=1 Tax=Nocardia sp. NPDC049149 TaxID=3364315 RepID=UPI003723CA80